MSQWVLRVFSDGLGERTIALRGNRLRLGSGTGNEVVLRRGRVHRIHALVLRLEAGFEIRDFSGDGVDLNGRRVARAMLHPGDRLRIGEHHLQVETERGGGSLPVSASLQMEPTTNGTVQRGATDLEPLVVRVPSRSGWKSCSLSGIPAFIGKSKDNDLVLDHPTVSRWHCRIVPGHSGTDVEDLDSTNGTWVNGARVQRAPLRPGASLRLGDVTLYLVAPEQSPAAEPPPVRWGLVGTSRPMQELYGAIERFGPHREPVLVWGETGCGKELIARALHAQSDRAAGPLVAVNCGALPRDLVESELFGHERGAFSGAHSRREGLFAEADGGTLFLDEVAELPLETQAKLLRVLETGEVRRVGSNRVRTVDARIVAASNRSLTEMIRQSRFRRDLYHRLSVIEMWVPPLRDRLEDIPLLVSHFLEQGTGMGKVISRSALDRLTRHRWPGNVRELRNRLRRGALLADGAVIEERHLRFEHAGPPREGEPISLAEIEREAIRKALCRNDGNKAAACRELGIARSTFFEKIRRYGLRDAAVQQPVIDRAV